MLRVLCAISAVVDYCNVSDHRPGVYFTNPPTAGIDDVRPASMMLVGILGKFKIQSLLSQKKNPEEQQRDSRIEASVHNTTRTPTKTHEPTKGGRAKRVLNCAAAVLTSRLSP